MSHDHNHSNAGSRRQLYISFFLIAGFMVVEAVGGWYTNSLALLSDAGHMLTDAGALGLSIMALKIGERPPTTTKTFGYRRFEILAALFNGLALWAIVGGILHEAYSRFMAPPQVKAPGMIAVASLGLVVNLISIKLLHSHKDDNINIRGAFLHVVADSLGSVGALVAGVAIMYTGQQLLDPLISLLICLLILWSSWGIVRDAVHILVLGVPPHIDYDEVAKAIVDHPAVCCVYDLHIWSISSGQEAVSAHVVVGNGFSQRQELLRHLVAELEEAFGIGHATIQIEESHQLKDSQLAHMCSVNGPAVSCSLPPPQEKTAAQP